MHYKKQGHAVYYAQYHIVVCTRYRRRILRWGAKEYLLKVIRGISKYYPEIEIKEVNTDLNHMHVLVSIPPKYAVSKVVNLIKSNTGRRLRERFKFLDKLYVRQEGIWSVGYFVSTVGINEAIVKKYIERQGDEDRGQTKFAF